MPDDSTNGSGPHARIPVESLAPAGRGAFRIHWIMWGLQFISNLLGICVVVGLTPTGEVYHKVFVGVMMLLQLYGFQSAASKLSAARHQIEGIT